MCHARQSLQETPGERKEPNWHQNIGFVAAGVVVQRRHLYDPAINRLKS
jgi:hypothetical protein